MHKLLPLLLLLLVATGMVAKQSPGGENLNPFADRTAVSHYPDASLPLPLTEALVTDYLLKTLPNMRGNGPGFVLTAHKTSPGGEHFTFDQTYKDVPVFNSQIKINLGKEGKVYSIFDNSYPIASWSAQELAASIEKANNLSLVEFLATHTGYTAAQIEESAVIAVIDNQPAVYKRLQLYHPESGDHRLYLVDMDGAIVYSHDLNAYSGVPATAYVFNPDPITSAQTVYGAPYVDSNNANTLVLRNERVLVNIDVKLDNGRYYLENDHFIMADFSGPNQTVVSTTTPSFLFTRADTAFEEVNAYYHLTKFQTYVDSLGFTTLTLEQVQVDAHALNGSDNSQFSYGSGPRLFFGDGFVDDAEDADVVVHEYGHALSHFASPLTNFGNYRQALDEGFGDYFAASYSRSISAYRWSDIFTWDGHNEFWIGRDAATTKKHPGDLTTSIHRNGELWATALMEVWSALGREKADKLALQTLFYLSVNMNFTDAAYAYLQADSACFGGANYNLIYTIMQNRGFFDPVGTQPTAKQPIVPFALYNSWAFTHRGEPAVIKNFTGQPMSFTLIDLSGKVLQRIENSQGDDLVFEGSHLAPGTYIIQVSAGSEAKSFRLVK